MVRISLLAGTALAVFAATVFAVRDGTALLPSGRADSSQPSRFEHAFARLPQVTSASIVSDRNSKDENAARAADANTPPEDRRNSVGENAAIQPVSDERVEVQAIAPSETFTVAAANIDPANSAKKLLGAPGLRILQIGDSHTSADFFSGEVRRRLQARYGEGATGYMTAGLPHHGDVRSSSLKITASSGWTYKSLQSTDANPNLFWLSGYDAVATKQGEAISFASERSVPFETVEIEALREPGAGGIEVLLDGHLEKQVDLAADRVEPFVLQLRAQRANAQLHEIQIRTTKDRKVSIASVSIYANGSGLTYNSVGYVGATIGILNKMEKKLFASDLRRINPQIVVLSFGTNEAADKSLDLVKYKQTYEGVIEKIRSTLRDAIIVMILPPDFNQPSPECPKEKVKEAICAASASWRVADAASMPSSGLQCVWQTPANLALVRDTQRDIAKQRGLAYWNWAEIMPSDCGAHQWNKMSPALMSRDHVHFTVEGYRRSADQFLDTLIPIIERTRADNAAFR
jgi:lysophospholipase L1-like esterase